MNIAIVGAGLGGTVLAHALVKQAKQTSTTIKVTLFERDDSESSRSQGIAIGLRQEGIDVLIKDLELTDRIDHLFSTKGARDLCLIGASSPNPLLTVSDLITIKINDQARSSLVNRAEIRDALIQSLPPEISLIFGKRCTGYKEVGDKVKLLFENDNETFEELYDVIVAADGAKSAIRSQRCPELIPEDIGYWTDAGLIVFDTPPPSLESNVLFKAAQTALVRKSGKRGASLLAFVHFQTNGTYRLLWSVSTPKSLAEEYGLNLTLSLPELKEKTEHLISDCFTPEAVELVKATQVKDMFVGYHFFSVLPATLKSNPLQHQPKSRVTVIGDAAHKTTTQAGLGATAAFQDAISLAKQLITGSGDIPTRLRDYEKEMVVRAGKAVSASVTSTARIHNASTTSVAIFEYVIYFVGGVLWVGQKLFGAGKRSN
ncbi:hypothetical protein HDU97_005127 [Phlyctochytrium planicorne]|nr:hypothetical protein HDU97_005127 [Phlyctochytrium planicorne]